ncbi:MAG: shikimate kinase [Myxococcales bacterium]|nr:helix-turn-helix domain-containing protein [Myxococcota bacterium]MDW8284415.1 shikimate kinase [Myxococcales bacterium]
MALGRAVQQRRRQARWSRGELSLRSGVSVRFLAQLEAGHNVSLRTLAQVAEALGQRPSQLLAEAEALAAASRRVALIGLRGAGKSTIGRRLAAELGRPFIELDERIEEAAGLSLGEIFALHGEAYYRRLERTVLARLLQEGPPGMVLAVGGGLVTDAESFELLRRHTITVWLRAAAQDHWDRVIQQGDRRPMAAGLAEARGQLEQLLAVREPLYRQAHLTIDTSALGLEGAVLALKQQLA